MSSTRGQVMFKLLLVRIALMVLYSAVANDVEFVWEVKVYIL